MGKAIVIVCLFILTSTLGEVNSLKCYDCTSLNNTKCADPFKAFDSLIECPKLDKREATLCRKLRQTIDTPEGKVLRFTRSCGYIRNVVAERDDECFKASFTAFSSSRYCACEGDSCNASDTISKLPACLILVTLFYILNIAT